MNEIGNALRLSLQVAAIATVFVAVIGSSLGYLLVRYRFPGRDWLEAIVTLPLVLPPVVVGYLLLILLGRNGAIGHLLYELTGWTLVFTWQGAAIAAAVVALPLMVKTTKAALESVDPAYLKAASTLRQSPSKVLFRVWLPLAWKGILAGVVLSFGRALGEFGATLMVAGNIPGVTQTMPMAIYQKVQMGNDREAAVLVGILSAIAIAVVFLSKYLERSNAAP
ncbi:molybdate ABC transporter permease subunit [Baaleninema simplex]|uniref:molybdate ABC transporter permease subunit n=1 Tax=Baaleninema simplex TaxID=2862350 RepID=UPI000344CBAE|nr:molybdate ABC transporter permease subunit [Baaleninema simplex]